MPRRTRRRLSPHFVIEEFDSHDGGLVPADQVAAIQHLVDWLLEPLRAAFGPVTVLSGYRTASHNAAVGGARASVHMLRTPLPGRGQRSGTAAAAADVTVAGQSPFIVAGWSRAECRESAHLAAKGRGGVGRYPNFVHLDTGPARNW
jgi:uncharacterized protein YcbK (DUF882 family)